MEILLSIGIGVGLASVAGLRAFLPLAIVGLFGVFGLFEVGLPFELVTDPIILTALFILSVVEGLMDKAASLQTVSDVVMTPLRIASGAILFAAATEAGLGAAAVPELVAGGVIAGVVAVARIFLRPASSGSGVSPAFLSGFEDAAAFVGGVVAVFVAFLPLALVGFILFFFYRVRKRRGRKYEGLRILGD